jgi:glycosyltransferase involved in cell wall biosynthesis
MHVFALPSYREGMPRSIIEAMATGLPVVATNIRGSREEVVHGETGYLVPVRDPATLGGALARVLSDLDLAREMGRKGRRRAEVYFDERKVLQRQVSLYASLVQEKIPQYAGVISPLP